MNKSESDSQRMGLYSLGMDDSEIGKIVGYTPQAIYAWRKKYGLPTLWKRGKKHENEATGSQG